MEAREMPDYGREETPLFEAILEGLAQYRIHSGAHPIARSVLAALRPHLREVRRAERERAAAVIARMSAEQFRAADLIAQEYGRPSPLYEHAGAKLREAADAIRAMEDE